jgi:YgiT-type zinc finger domain-containing protein
MKCPMCRRGETAPGKATLTYELGTGVLVVRGVPAEICDFCGDEYLDEETVERLDALLAKGCTPGVEIELREYTAA